GPLFSCPHPAELSNMPPAPVRGAPESPDHQGWQHSVVQGSEGPRQTCSPHRGGGRDCDRQSLASGQSRYYDSKSTSRAVRLKISVSRRLSTGGAAKLEPLSLGSSKDQVCKLGAVWRTGCYLMLNTPSSARRGGRSRAARDSAPEYFALYWSPTSVPLRSCE